MITCISILFSNYNLSRIKVVKIFVIQNKKLCFFNDCLLTSKTYSQKFSFTRFTVPSFLASIRIEKRVSALL